MAENFLTPNNFICPAFTVKDGIIDRVNEAALNRGVTSGMDINTMICSGKTEYLAYTDGILCFCLQVCNTQYNATVSIADGQQFVCLESDYEEPELRAFALAAQELRAPLTNALAQTAQLLPATSQQQDPQAAAHTAKLNKSLHQLLRAVSNMSDAALYTNPSSANMQLQDMQWLLDELFQKANTLVQQTERSLEYHLPAKSMLCCVDKEKIERAIYNLISNAIKFSPKSSTIKVNVEQRNERLYLSVKNTASSPMPSMFTNFFTRFIREPGLEDPRSGIGLGLSIVRSVARMHKGTLLLQNLDDTICVTMSIEAKAHKNLSVHSPIKLLTDYAGGYDHATVEMADILPDNLFRE